MENWWYLIVLAFLLFVLFLLFAHDQNKRIVVSRYRIPAKIEFPFCIVHLSDLHSTKFPKLLSIVAAQKPDIIVFTGDLINDKGKRIPEMLAYITELSKLAPVFYVTGNHERRLRDFTSVMEQISNAGAYVLLNEIRTEQIRDVPVHILGLDENQGSFDHYKEMMKGQFHYKDNSAYFQQLAQLNGFRLVLTHFPENFACTGATAYQQFDFDLMLAGHAHGGQFILPLIGPVFSPGQGLFPKYARGMFGTRPKMIVSRGLGNSEFPLRLWNHPEVIQITITPKGE